MKTLKLLTLGIFAACLFNCSKDDDDIQLMVQPEPTIHEQVAYRWYFSKTTNPETGETTIADACAQNIYYEFLLNGDFNAEIFESQSDGSCVSENVVNATYEILEIDGDTGVMITDDDGNTEGSIIVSVSETELVLEQRGFGVRHLTFVRS